MIPFPFGLESTILFPVSNEFMDEKLNNSNVTDLEYCASTAIMLAEEIWQIAEGFAELPAYF